jgi:4-aminobutyrate aminotransferase/(S)-3-amino-2-methylpropionate transaminase
MPPTVSEACYRRGLVTITAGTYGNVIRTLMPLVITDAELEEGFDVLEAAVGEVSAASFN